MGAVSGATGTIVSWDSVNLTLKNVTGKFQNTEAISGTFTVSGNTFTVIGTVEGFQYQNVITNPATSPSLGTLDFSVFIPGYSMTIEGCPSNQYLFANPVTILSVNGNQIIVDTGSSQPFTYALGQVSVILTQYTRFVAESGPDGCTTASRYLTRQFCLANAANSLQVLFTINRPPGSYVDCYYRIQQANSTASFNSIIWQPMALDDTVDNGESSNPNEFKEYSYTANNLGAFTSFSIKLVMRGGNSSQVPKIQNFRGIALAD
jgi:hypothetical protein